MKRGLLFILFLTLVKTCFAQDDFPSKTEIKELAAKADEKVSVFEAALKSAKPLLQDEQFKNYADAASTAHLMLKILQEDGPSAYRLVALVMTLDDLVIDARIMASNILVTAIQFQSGGKAVPAAAVSIVNQLNEAAQACYDINELIGHATLRLIGVEEKLIDKIAK